MSNIIHVRQLASSFEVLQMQLQELVQNADDAEATDMGILYEGKTTASNSFEGLKYGKFFQVDFIS